MANLIGKGENRSESMLKQDPCIQDISAEFRINENDLTINFKSTLGSGNFGKV